MLIRDDLLLYIGYIRIDSVLTMLYVSPDNNKVKATI
jgi:hypothetical protein